MTSTSMQSSSGRLPAALSLSLMALAVIGLCVFLVRPRAVRAANTITVSNTNDSGARSLRQAITDANASTAGDTINFSLTGAIVFFAPLPSLSGDINMIGPPTTSRNEERAGSSA